MVMSEERLNRGVRTIDEVDKWKIDCDLLKWPPGTEVVARYSFKAKADEDLSFQKGDIITIITPTRVIHHNQSINY